jgi:hypothetical protein
MYINNLVAESLGRNSESGLPLRLTPNGKRLYNVLRSKSYTESLVATLFWQVFINSSLFAQKLRSLGCSALAFSHAEKFIVCHGEEDNPRYDLVVFDPLYDSDVPVSSFLNLSDERGYYFSYYYYEYGNYSYPHDGQDFLHAFKIWHRKRLENFSLALRRSWKLPNSVIRLLFSVLRLIDKSIIAECLNQKPFGILVARPPKILTTASVSNFSLGVPTPTLGIYSPPNVSDATSTVGVIASQNKKTIGMTASLHALRSRANMILPQDTPILVDKLGKTGLLKTIDEVSDSAFFEIEVNDLLSLELKQVLGPLSGLSPRCNERADFEGISSSNKTVTVTGWSPDIPFVAPYNQLKVLTTPETEPGDSGAALIDKSDNILGFSFYRTGLGEAIEFSAWIWADSVFAAHKLHIT